MSSTTAVELAFVARLDQLERELAKLPNIGAKEAKKLVDQMSKEYRRNEREAKKAADSAAKEAERAARRAREAWQGQLDGIKGVGEETASLLGGIWGDLGSVAFGLTEKVGTLAAAMGGSLSGSLVLVGGSAAAASASMGLVVAGLREIVDGAIEARDRLTETNDLWGIPPDRLDSLRNYEIASAALAVQMDRIQVIAGGELAGNLAILATNLARLAESTEDAVSRTESLYDGFRWLSRLVSLGLVDAVYSYTDAQHEAIEASIDHERAVADQAQMLQALGMVVDENEDQLDTHNRRTREAAEEARKLAEAQREAERIQREYQTALKEGADEINERNRLERELVERTRASNEALASVIADATSDQMTAEQRVREAYEKRIELIRDVGRTASDTGKAQRAELETQLRLQRDLQDIESERVRDYITGQEQMISSAQVSVEQMLAALDQMAAGVKNAADERIQQLFSDLDAVGSIAGDVGGLLELLHQTQIEDIQNEWRQRDEAFKARRQQEREAIDQQLQSGRISKEQHQQMIADLREENKAKREAHREQRRDAHQQLRKAFNAQKNAQRAQAIIDASRAALALIPGYAYLGPGATLAAAVSAGAALTAQLVQINRQKPPEFPMGGSIADRFGATSPDHRVISARLDEGIVSPRGMAALGPEGLDALNSGTGSAGSMVVLELDGRAIAEAYERHGRARLRPMAGRVTGRAPVYGRG